VKGRFSVSAAVLLTILALPAPAQAGIDNPCIGPGSGHLLCPNLRIGPPTDLYATHPGGGRVLLRTTSDVRSRGRGPIELRRVGPNGKLGRVLRTSPKLNYCLRDLERTRPGRRSPSSRHYPGCNQNPYKDRVTLGTSVGWSDIYPADYSKQWINVAGLRGCFAFTMTVDPKHLLYESSEHDNTSRRLVRLPFRGDVGC
jgi:hypothetical protein